MDGLTPDMFVTFAGTLALAILSPGPGVISVTQAAFAMGRARALPYALGLAFGASLWCLSALLGLAVLFRVVPALFLALKVGGGAYLLWIGWKMWRGAPDPLPDPAEKRFGTGFRGGMVLNLSNPKPALFYSAVLLSIFPRDLVPAERALIYAVAGSIELGFYTALATIMSLPPLRQRYYSAKLWIDRVAAMALGALGLSLIVRH